MPRVPTHELTASKVAGLSHTDAHHIYNGLDCCITFEVFEAIHGQIKSENDPSHALIYDFERGMQAPALEMMRRGFKVDEYERRVTVDRLERLLGRAQALLDKFAGAVWGKPLNANSPKQLQLFFYSAMGLPPVELSFKGVRRITTNREALEKLSIYLYAVPIINCILAVRDIKKKLSLLTTEISADGRFRTSYNVAGTETGRWNSSSDAFGDGSNLQNISVELRKVFISDPGKKLGHLDLEQAESRVVGLLVWALVDDSAYLDACESGDLHTYVAKLLWPEKVTDKRSAEQLFYRHFSFRDMSKRGGHASNYRVTPWTMSRHLKIAQALAQEFQALYFGRFPGIPEWHVWIAKQLNFHQELTTPLGRRRIFFGRPGDDATLREAIAFTPQSTVGDLLNTILWRTWTCGLPIELPPWAKRLPVELLTQEHDGFTFQYPDDPGAEAEIFAALPELANISIAMKNSQGQTRTMLIPAELSCGWNWAPGDKPPFWDREKNQTLNPNGLMKWRGRDERKRLTGLDRVVS